MIRTDRYLHGLLYIRFVILSTAKDLLVNGKILHYVQDDILKNIILLKFTVINSFFGLLTVM